MRVYFLGAVVAMVVLVARALSRNQVMHDIVSLLRVRVHCLMSALFRIDPTCTVVSVVSWPWSAYALLRVLGVRLGDWGWIVGGALYQKSGCVANTCDA